MASFEQPLFKIGFLVAAADLRTKQYCFVYVDSNGKAALPTSTGQVCIGVLQNKPNSGEACEILVIGVTNLQADGTGLTAGDKIEAVQTTGVAQVATGAGTNIVATCLETAAASAVFPAFVNCGTGYLAS